MTVKTTELQSHPPLEFTTACQLCLRPRDPIGYLVTEEIYTYVRSAPLVLADASGMLSIRVTGAGSDATKTCGNEKFRKWKFRLVGKTICDEGYLVQKVTVKCKKEACEPCGEGDHCGNNISEGTFSYWEAFYVKGRDVLDRRTWTDRAYMTPDHESCGSYEQEGEIRFYCIEDTGDLGKLEIPGKWKVDERHGAGTGCVTTGGDLPTTGEEPDFWKAKPENDVEAATRSFSVNWHCCDPDKTNRKAEVDYDP